MKYSLMSIMKQIKELEARKESVIDEEDGNCTVTYLTAQDKEPSTYNYAQTRAAIAELDKQILHLKSVLNYNNCVVKVYGYDYTIGQALVRLAQLSRELKQLDSLPARQQRRNVLSSGIIQYTDCCFDTKQVKQDILALRSQIAQLQIAIDRTNLTYEVEIDMQF